MKILKTLIVGSVWCLAPFLSAEIDQAILEKCEKSFNAITTLNGTFEQIMTINNQRYKDSGEFWIKNPSKMRMNYRSGLELVADKSNLILYDKKMDQTTTIPLFLTPAKVLLTYPLKIKSSSSLTVTKTFHTETSFGADLVMTEAPTLGSIQVNFNSKTNQLEGWIIFEHTQTTEVRLHGSQKANIDDKIFHLSRQKLSSDTQRSGTDF